MWRGGPIFENVEAVREATMLTFDDCLGLCELTQEEIAAIAEHEHIPEMLAVELGSYLLHSPGGAAAISRMIADDIEAAVIRGEHLHAAKLKLALKQFCEAHLKAAAVV
jgi:hypothetical protein